MIFLGLLALLLLGATVGLIVWGIILPRAREAERLKEITVYGASGSSPVISKGAEKKENPTLWVIPQRLGGIVGKWVGLEREENLRKELRNAAIYSLSPKTFIGLRVLTAVG